MNYYQQGRELKHILLFRCCLHGATHLHGLYNKDKTFIHLHYVMFYFVKNVLLLT